jgi:hypothetical protein
MEEMLVDDIPHAVKEEIFFALMNYTVGFLLLRDTAHGRDATLVGSGTLVSIGYTRAILTAHHVIKILPRSSRLGIFIGASIEPESIDVGGLTYLEIDRGIDDSVGPDLGAVVLAPPVAGTIAAKKLFYNLASRREQQLQNPPQCREGIWFMHGFAAENTRVKAHPETGYRTTFLYNYGGIGRPQTFENIGRHDYMTVPLDPSSPPPTPKSFGGMSGCGLWQVRLERNMEGKIEHKTPLLSGVVFYQHAANASAIRSHGRRSVYGVAYDAINGDFQMPRGGSPQSRRS